MPTPETILSVIKEITTHRHFLTSLLTPEVEALSKKIFTSLEESNPIVNPGREKPAAFKTLPPNIQELIAVQAALDVIHSAKYNQMIKQQVSDTTTARIDKTQMLEGPVKHIKEEGTVIYHGVYHPIESAAVTAPLVQRLMGNKIPSDEVTVLKHRAETLFVHHDRIQNLDEANKRKDGYKTTKIEGFNEVETAGVFFEERFQLYQEEIEKLSQSAGHESEIAKLKAMQDELAYESWKFIVGGTTMLKTVDGQPTLNTLQVLAVDPILDISADQRTALESNPLVAASLAASAVDSHFPALLTLIKNHPEMGANLPHHLMQSGVINSSPELRSLIFLKPDDPDAVNQTSLFLGQNMRMFSEIHESYFSFGSALTKIQSVHQPDSEDSIHKDGVSLWNEAMHAARMGDNDKLKELLSLKIESFKGDAPAGVTPGMTLVDIFMLKLQGEISFANGQGPELIAKAAENRGLDASVLDVSAWKNHALALEKIKKAYDDGSPAIKSSIALVLFQIAGNQPGLYVDNKNLLANIEKEQLSLTERSSTLLEDRQTLQKAIERLTTEITLLETSAEKTAGCSVSKMSLLLSGADSKPQFIQTKKDSLQKKQNECTEIDAQLKDLDSQQRNLERVKNNLQHINSALKEPEEAHIEQLSRSSQL